MCPVHVSRISRPKSKDYLVFVILLLVSMLIFKFLFVYMFLMSSIFDRPSVEDSLPILDIKNLKDPDKFFMAHEPLQSDCCFFSLLHHGCIFWLIVFFCIFYFIDAGREIQAVIVPSEPNQDSTKPRECRPGLPGFIRRYQPNTSSLVSLRCVFILFVILF